MSDAHHEPLTPPEKMDSLCRIRVAMSDIMAAMGLDPSELGLIETPDRVARFLLEFSRPADLVGLLKAFDHEAYEGDGDGLPMVIVQKIPLAALCEHHFCPFFGHVAIGYIPNGKIVGLSKLARLVDAAGHKRPSVQERLTNEIANAIDAALNPKGVYVIAKATHTCMCVRGVAKAGVETITSAIRGAYVHSPGARSEFLGLIDR